LTVYLVTGPMAAGKSTVAGLLARRFERGVHLEGDVFRRGIVSGRIEMTPDAGPEALEQLELRYGIAAEAADRYAEAGFDVVLEDVVAGELLHRWRMLVRSRPCHLFVLLPSVEAVAQRAAARSGSGYDHFTVEGLHALFAEETPRVGVWLDTTRQTPEETVETILARTPRAPGPIVVVEYDERWPALFEALAAPIREAVGARVEHVGSTAVPGLAAKPVIDIDVVVPVERDVPAAVERLRGLGYVHQGDKGIPGREAFLWPEGMEPHQVYVVVAGGEPLANHLAFRDRLRADPALAARYAALKRELAARHGTDRLAYTEAKDAFVAEVLG
jgi:GrpB-like predicted nucleotidyltransferase (UPF0157 family)